MTPVSRPPGSCRASEKGRLMDYDTFLDAITRRVPVTLAERLTRGETDNLASEPPEPLKEPLVSRTPEAGPSGLDEFVSRVSRRAGVSPNEARAGRRHHRGDGTGRTHSGHRHTGRGADDLRLGHLGHPGRHGGRGRTTSPRFPNVGATSVRGCARTLGSATSARV
ncbi:DUF2267 domain-containing protein [Streptomyces sp. NPDC059629]|uniref:DUF2267 domain-containing protein n=1 Tax=Streptomyces sp. NPDC059629 TaxID=3346889 RepID=UPI003685A531